MFCGIQCAYPDPLVKDLYVEVDWMNDGITDFKPTSAQIDQVKDAFADKDINLHVDTGQYGGGDNLTTYVNELPVEPILGSVDFFDLKNGNVGISMGFSATRKDIWRYMVTGDKRTTNSTGGTYAGTGNIFIAIGRVKELNPTDQDEAVAGTILHELGHSLCLTGDSAYSGQNPACVFDGIDNNNASSNYVSAMNYNKQFTTVDYSSGVNGVGDHDDWAAIMMGMDDFVGKLDPAESQMLFKRDPVQMPED